MQIVLILMRIITSETVPSCSPLVRALVYQPSGPFRDSYYKVKPDHATATHQVFLYYMLCMCGHQFGLKLLHLFAMTPSCILLSTL